MLNKLCGCPKYLALILFVICAGGLGAAYVAEYGFDLRPCILCIYERYPYWGVLALMILANFHVLSFERAFLYSGFLFLAGALISAYHVGIEFHWFPAPKICGGGFSKATSAEEISKIITSRPLARCDVPLWTFMGISVVVYNMLLSFVLAATTLKAWCCACKSGKK